MLCPCWSASVERHCNRTFCCRYYSIGVKLVFKIFGVFSRLYSHVFDSLHKNRFGSSTRYSYALKHFSQYLMCCFHQTRFFFFHLNLVRKYRSNSCGRGSGYQALVCFVLRTFQLRLPLGYGKGVSRGLIRADCAVFSASSSNKIFQNEPKDVYGNCFVLEESTICIIVGQGFMSSNNDPWVTRM